MWADHAGPPVRIVGYHRVLWEMWEGWSWSPCNTASLEHFYNPDKDAAGKSPGLNLAAWGLLKDALGGALATAFTTAGTAGIYSHTVTVEPNIFHQHKSAADLCEECYQKALRAYAGYETLPGRSNLQTAMFYLGWALHLVGDMGVTQHTWDNWITHEDYEHYANGKGGEPIYHAATARDPSRNINAYQPAWTARRFATETAKVVHTWQQFHWAEGAGSQPTMQDDLKRLSGIRGQRNFHAALKEGIPPAEMYTAGLIAKFMKDIGVPEQAPPLRGCVYDEAHNAVPGAYLFYRTAKPVHRAPAAGSPSQAGGVSYKPSQGPWDYVRADQQGRFTLGTVQPGSHYFIRPAMPGYRFEGAASGEGGALGEFVKQSPVLYSHQYGLSSPTLNVYLKRGPGPRLMELQLAPEQASRLRPVLWGPSAAVKASLVKAGTALPQSGGAVSPRLSENLHRAMIEVNADGYSLGVPNSGTGLPDQAYVTIQLYRLMDARTGAVVQSPQQAVHVIDMNRASLQQRASASAPATSAVPPEPQFSQQAVQMMAQSLRTTQATGPDGTSKNIVVLPSASAGFPCADLLLGNGIIPLPTLAGAEIRAEVIPGPGHISPVNTQPITLVTNQAGKAAFTVRAGSEAGKLQVKLTVVKHPAATQILPEKAVEFIVHPALQGPDPAQRSAVALGVAPLMITGTVAPTAPAGQVAVAAGQPPTQAGQAPIAGGQGIVQPPSEEPMQQMPITGAEAPAGAVGPMSEDFESAPLSGWEFGGGAQVGALGQGRALTFGSPGHGFWVAASAQDFTLQFRCFVARGAGEVIFCASGEPPQDSGYHLIITPEEYELAKQVGEQRQILSGGPCALQPGRWYAMVLQNGSGQIQLTADGQSLLSARDAEPLAAGILGFGCVDGTGFAYDDIRLTPGAAPIQAQMVMPGTEEPQTQAGGLTAHVAQTIPEPGTGQSEPGAGGTAATRSEDFEATPQGWEFHGGAQVQTAGQGRALVLSGPGHGVWTAVHAGDFALRLRYRHAQGAGDILFRGSGEPPQNQEYHLIFADTRLHLLRLSAGQEQEIQSAACQLQPGSWYDVAVQASGGQIAVFVGGQQVLTATDPQPLPAGIVGFGSGGGSGFAYDDISISAAQAPTR